MEFEDDKFDYVLSTESFHHYPDHRKAISEMKRVCKNGGEIIIVDFEFCFSSINFLFEKFEPGCTKLYTKEQLNSLLEEFDLKILSQNRVFVVWMITVARVIK